MTPLSRDSGPLDPGKSGTGTPDWRSLSQPQLSLLSSLYNTDYGALCLRGPDLRTVRILLDLNYVEGAGGRWHEITPAGRAAHEAAWEAGAHA